MTHSKSGITLIEICVALAIVAIISGLAVTDFTAQAPHRQLRESSRHLVGQLRLARQRAIADGKDTTIYFLPEEMAYNALGIRNNLPNHVAFDPTKQLERGIIFQPNGTIKPPTRTIFLKNSRDESVEITVNVTGRVKIK